MPLCKLCEEDVDQLVRVRIEGRSRRVCEECADQLRDEQEIAEASEAVVQQMMGFKGRR